MKNKIKLFYHSIVQAHISTLLLFLPSTCHASDMGNGPAGIVTWIFGGFLSVAIALFSASSRNGVSQVGNTNYKKFFIVLVILAPIVLVAGVVAIFIF